MTDENTLETPPSAEAIPKVISDARPGPVPGPIRFIRTIRLIRIPFCVGARMESGIGTAGDPRDDAALLRASARRSSPPHPGRERVLLSSRAPVPERRGLAERMHDTTGAARAYRHFLVIRDRPDPGPIADEVRDVRSRLSALTRRE